MSASEHTPGLCRIGQRGAISKTCPCWHEFAKAGTPYALFREDGDATLFALAPEMLEALERAAELLRMYHKGEEPGHLDACEMPDCCAHCKAMRVIKPLIRRARGEEVTR